ncbi:glycosyltransferase [Dermabacteraceae bacterium P13077]
MVDRPLRIAMFTEVFLPKIDGVVTTVIKTIEYLRREGHEILVIAPGNPQKEYLGARVEGIASFPFKPYYPEISVGLPMPKIGRLLREFQPDVVHAVSPLVLGGWGILHAYQQRLPIVASYHTDIPQYTEALGLGALRNVARNWLLTIHNRADVNLCPSVPLTDIARRDGMRRVRLWPGAVDTELFRPDQANSEMRERLSGGEPERPLVLSVGRLSKEKCLDQLIPVMERLPEARIAFVGTGPFEDELKRKFAHLPATFPGVMRGEELAQAFASSDVFAFPSTTDTLGLVSLESLASGVPVVGANAGGIPDTIHHGKTGFLVQPGDHDGFARCLRSVYQDRDARTCMGEAAREDALKRSWTASTEIIEQAYADAMARLHVRSVDDALTVLPRL